MLNIEAYDIPGYMYEGIYRYVEHRILPGSFLEAVLCNDLKEAVARADGQNIRRLPEYVRFLFNEVPTNCWGSPQAVKEWLTKGE